MDPHFNRSMDLELRLGFATLARAQGVLKSNPAWCRLWDLGLVTWITMSEYHIHVDEETTELAWRTLVSLRRSLQEDNIIYTMTAKISNT